MTVRELLSMGLNVNYATTKVSIYDRNNRYMIGLPAEFPESVKNAHVKEYFIDGVREGRNNRCWIAGIIITIEERGLL